MYIRLFQTYIVNKPFNLTIKFRTAVLYLVCLMLARYHGDMVLSRRLQAYLGIDNFFIVETCSTI